MVPMTNPTERGSGALCWIRAICCLGGLVIGLAQWRLISQLQHENEELRKSAQSQETEVFNLATTSSPESESQDKTELLRLRNEVRLLRDEFAQVKTARPN